MTQTQKEKAPEGASIEKQGKDNSLILLRQEYLEWHRKKFPDWREGWRAVPTFTDKTTNGLTKCIKTLAKIKGFHCERVANHGRLVDNTSTFVDVAGRVRKIGSVNWIRGSGMDGSADLHMVVAGRAIFVEIKRGYDKLSEAQQKYKASVERSGAMFVVIRSFAEFVTWCDELVKEEVKP